MPRKPKAGVTACTTRAGGKASTALGGYEKLISGGKDDDSHAFFSPRASGSCTWRGLVTVRAQGWQATRAVVDQRCATESGAVPPEPLQGAAMRGEHGARASSPQPGEVLLP